MNTHRLWSRGQSPWLDDISKCMLDSGQLKRMVYEEGIRGVTTNPTIFDKAISSGQCGYPDEIRQLLAKGKSPVQVYEALSAADVRGAADVMRRLYDDSGGTDGFVSWEEAPEFAFNQDQAVSEAKRLAGIIDRPNLFVKIPSTPQGAAALRHVIRLGISVNMTLMFSHEQYSQIAQSYIAGLEDRLADGGSLVGVRSVASVFVSRIDNAVNKALAAFPKEPTALALRGKIAVANTKMIYQDFLRIFSGPRWEKLAAQGAKVQRPLWASTGTKDPSYSDTLYVDSLIGPNTVNTLPAKTIEAFQDHGVVKGDTICEGVDQAQAQLSQLARLGVSLEQINATLLTDGVKAFADSYNQLLRTISGSLVEVAHEG